MSSYGATRAPGSRRGARRALSGLTLAVLVLAAVLAAACGSNEPSRLSAPPAAPAPPPAEVAPAPEPPPPAPAAAPDNELPEVAVINVVSGESLVLSSLAPADRPILAWFWAPH